MQPLASHLCSGSGACTQQLLLPARKARRDVSAQAESNKRYSSRYTREDTQEINQRRANGYSSSDDRWSGENNAGSWNGQNGNNYDRQNSWERSAAPREDSREINGYGGNYPQDYGQRGGSSWSDAFSSAASRYPSFDEVMNWSGAAPEIINGRLAMLGFFGAMCAELATSEPVYIQFWLAPLPVLSAIGTITVASLFPILRNQPSQSYGPYFTPYVEKVNARAAMIGFALLIIIETFTGRALFTL